MEFTPYGHCLLWSVPLITATVLGHALVFASYTWIPVSLRRVVGDSATQTFVKGHRLTVALFGLFILLCGFTHVMNILTMWIPLWWESAILTLTTGGVSMFTAKHLHSELHAFVLAQAEAAKHREALIFSKDAELAQLREGLQTAMADVGVKIKASEQWQQFYEGFWNFTPSILLAFERDGTLVSCNRAFESLLGYTMEEYNDKSVRGSAFDVEEANNYLAQLETRIVIAVTTVKAKDGTQHEILWKSSPYKDGIAYTVGVDLSDIRNHGFIN